MSGSVNKVILIGRLGKDPEVKYTPSGTPVAKFTLATDEVFKDRSGEQQRRTEWHNVVAWSKLAEICGEYLTKGKQIYIEGSIRSGNGLAKTGQIKFDRPFVKADFYDTTVYDRVLAKHPEYFAGLPPLPTKVEDCKGPLAE